MEEARGEFDKQVSLRLSKEMLDCTGHLFGVLVLGRKGLSVGTMMHEAR